MKPKEIVLSFWRAMESNDFYKTSEWLSENFEGHWPQSREVIVGRSNFGENKFALPGSGKMDFQS